MNSNLRKFEKVLVLILNLKNKFNWNLEFHFFSSKIYQSTFDMLFLIWLVFSNKRLEKFFALLFTIAIVKNDAKNFSMWSLKSFDPPKHNLCIFIYLEFQYLLRSTAAASVFFLSYLGIWKKLNSIIYHVFFDNFDLDTIRSNQKNFCFDSNQA